MIRCFLFLCLLGLALASPGQSVHTIGFYNLENLFDTEDDPEKNDEDFTPEGRNQWTGERYRQKLDNMAKVMAGIGHGNDPELIGLCELENRRVIEDLVQHPTLAAKRYQIVHFESPDRRGIDVALVYKPQVFQPFATAQVEISFPGEPDYKTRNALVVSGLMEKDTLTLIVNHWPSRRGGGEDNRIFVARQVRRAVDSLLARNPQAKIIVMGDFNDDPNNASLRKHLRAQGKLTKLAPGDLYNTLFDTFKQGFIGTLRYDGVWNLFDQLLISQALLEQNHDGGLMWVPGTARIYNQPWMFETSGKYQGYPKRSFSNGVWNGGYSDHFPVYLYLSTQKVSPIK